MTGKIVEIEGVRLEEHPDGGPLASCEGCALLCGPLMRLCSVAPCVPSLRGGAPGVIYRQVGNPPPPKKVPALQDIDELYGRFAAEADKLRIAGRTHYSARTIGEYLRHSTTLRTGADYKINNNLFPALARRYMQERGCPDFFATRGGK